MSDNRETEKITKAEFDNQIRDLIDRFYQSGGEVDDVEEVLEHHLNGAEYYIEDLQRMMRLQQQSAHEEENSKIKEDSVEQIREE